MPKPIIIICGPTASGKTQLSLSIAQKHDSVIINADSMQLYQEIPIISAQPTVSEQKTAPHRLFSILSVTDSCSVARWIKLVCAEIDAAHNQNKIPVLVGGTGMYLSSLINGLSEIPSITDTTKEHSRSLLETIGNKAFVERLAEHDPLSAQKLNINDTQRILRAYDVIYQTGKPLSYWQNEGLKTYYEKEQFQSYFVNPPRDILYDRCNKRFDAMLDSGLMDEIRYVHSLKLPHDLTAMKALGLRELLAYLNEEKSYEDAVIQAKTVTRRYAKRQITWFKNQLDHKAEITDPLTFDPDTLNV
ncbi:MAG: tRNA (adenosine(37)-N6)-dimethylallyltransferase MiaA [Rickettsiales bacterium]|nr:tRNA (adenosine(37)-N6)-dimethylallyltransferase MiaA [Rickettsiales bacterium]